MARVISRFSRAEQAVIKQLIEVFRKQLLKRVKEENYLEDVPVSPENFNKIPETLVLIDTLKEIGVTKEDLSLIFKKDSGVMQMLDY